MSGALILSAMLLKLEIKNLGAVPSFKNSKQIAFNRKTRRPFICTDKKKKQWMESAIHSLECQLRILFPTAEGETLGEWQKRLQTASFMPLDDCWEQMLPGNQDVVLVPKGSEGCEIVLERIK